MRWLSSIVLVCASVLGTWGPRIFTGSPAVRRSAMDWLGQVDDFFRDTWSPTLVIVGLGGLLGIWIAAPIARLIVDKWFGAKTREFNAQFAAEHHQRARNNFAWFLEAAYRKYDQSGGENALARALDNLRFPDNFPPSKTSLHDYASDMAWPTPHSERLFAFFRSQFHDILEKPGERRFWSDRYTGLADLVRIPGKFWDDWAHEINDGKLDTNRWSDKSTPTGQL